MSAGARLHVTGIVQGVGFRPFVFSLADRLGLAGWVRNTSAGVDIEVDGPSERLQDFARAIREEAPPLARIDGLEVSYGPAKGSPRKSQRYCSGLRARPALPGLLKMYATLASIPSSRRSA